MMHLLKLFMKLMVQTNEPQTAHRVYCVVFHDCSVFTGKNNCSRSLANVGYG